MNDVVVVDDEDIQPVPTFSRMSALPLQKAAELGISKTGRIPYYSPYVLVFTPPPPTASGGVT